MGTIKFKFEDLKVYEKALDFVDLAYEISKSFPSTEKFGLTSQFTRAAVSIALNIAEGSSDSDKQFNRFLQMALDSVNECVVCATISKRQKFISNQTNDTIREKLVELSKMITSLQKYLRNKTNL
ncbi:four helix bundle protein [uncultured Algibacter sp.]|uniref:four helix bundle protein n=1 Tax=uncultured Algibacter sp. TaxID=298659 RepID=UPI0026031C02|nr:four helix bundle protein [uncultured Algibacter sp.]